MTYQQVDVATAPRTGDQRGEMGLLEPMRLERVPGTQDPDSRGG